MPTRKPIPDPTVPLLDPATGRMTRPWYDYFKVNDGLGIAGLLNVKGSDVPADNEVLTWDSSVNQWNAEPIPTPTAPGLVLIQTQLASGASQVDFTSGLNDSYDRYLIIIDSLKPDTDDVALHCRIGTGAGPTYQASGYNYQFHESPSAANTTGTAQAQLLLNRSGAGVGIGNAAGEHLNAEIWLSNPEAGNLNLIAWQTSHVRADATPALHNGSGFRTTAEAMTAIRFLLSSGNIASGRFSLYGLKKP